MPTVTAATGSPSDLDVEVVGVGAFSGDDRAELAPDAAMLAEVSGLDLAAELEAMGFDGSAGTLARIPGRGAVQARVIVVVGLGSRDDADAVRLRKAAASLAATGEHAATIATTLAQSMADLDAQQAAQAVAEGILLGSYRFTSYKTEPTPFALEQATLLVEDVEVATKGIEIATVTADAAMLARDLVNTPPQDKRPPQLADRAVAMVDGLPIDVRVLDETELAEGGYGGILGVGQGSSVPPRLVELRYRPDGARRHVALVGKGITFDTGGISLKPSASMATMKSDMAGAATVVAVVRAAAQLGLDVEVTGLLALAENMPSGTATRVSDVLTMKGGTTVEVMNTDAEGRLVLGDALVHASELEPETIVDVATLTGAAVVALGDRIGVVIANDERLGSELVDVGRQAGEPLWQLPLAKDAYGDRVDGTFADLRNVGGREAGTIFAALFLERFVGESIAWAHLDIAAVAWTNDAYDEYTKGGTGVPARTLIEWLREL